MNNKNKNIAFFGGSFNPPHNAHIKIGKYLIDNFNFDEILYVPTYYTKHKNYNSIESYDDRYNMIKIAVDNMINAFIDKDIDKYSRIQVSDKEKKLYNVKKDYTYTYNVLKFIEDKNTSNNKKTKYTIVIGFDSIYNINTWYNYKELINEYEFIIFDRECGETNNNKKTYLQKLKNELNLKYIYIDNLELDDISSSIIRNKFNIYYKTNDNKILDELNKYLDKKVIKYIINNNLYKD